MKTSRKLLCILLTVVMLMSFVVSTYAASDDPDTQLKQFVYEQVKSNKYDKEGGGTVLGSALFDTTNGTYDLLEVEYNKLTSNAQTQLVKDIKAASDAAVEDTASASNVSEDTVQNWFKELQSLDGVGSKLMSTILSDTKPDFVTAKKIYEPFSGIVGTILGLLSILLMSFLGIVMVLDISYIALPPMRMFVGETNGRGKDGGGGGIKSNLVSNDAIYSVKVAEESDGTDGSKKQALGVYLKRRIPMLILLGVCLLYLVQGQIYTLVGWILDLVSGFLGF